MVDCFGSLEPWLACSLHYLGGSPLKGPDTYNTNYCILEPRHDPCFDRKLDHIFGGWWSNIAVIQVLGLFVQ